MHNPLVVAEKVSRRYIHGGSVINAIKEVTCSVSKGDHIAVTGPSGSGKSTLLYLLGGMDDPTSGTVRWPAIGGREALRPLNTAFVFQGPSLVESLSVLENVELPLLLGHIDEIEARTTALSVLEELELEYLVERLPFELSGGQAQRVSIARAMACRPRLLLMDEPTGHLDHATARQLFNILFAMLEEIDTALLVATHDPDIADYMPIQWRLRYGELEVI